ncbi:MAG: transposase [Paracoccaceae bacterium]|nr:transposase [Paracoccaceae bacterium]
MPNYRRALVPGATWFFTVVLARRGSNLLVTYIDALRTAIRTTRRERPFRIDAMVVLPDHLHAIWTLPPVDSDFPTRWRLIKSRFSRAIPAPGRTTWSRTRKSERGIWQRRYWEHLIRDEADLLQHVDYCHFNPVKHGLVTNPAEWPYSTFHRDVRRGLYPSEWGVEFDCRVGAPHPPCDIDFGEMAGSKNPSYS